MSETKEQVKHTPGPWQENGVDLSVRGPDGFAICHVVADDAESRVDANARLIAAAPELPEACRELAAGFSFAVQNGLTAKIMERQKVVSFQRPVSFQGYRAK